MKLPEEYWAKPDKTIKEHSLELIKELDRINELGYISDQRIYELTKKACLYHDLGKANPEFQKRVKSKTPVRMSKKREVYHNILSIFLINPKDFERLEDYYRVALAVLYHHNYTNEPLTLLRTEKEMCLELLKEHTCYRLKNAFKNQLLNLIGDNEVVKIKGLLHKCDYSASGAYVSEYPNDFLEAGLESLNYNWNDLQKFCMINRDENIIVVAQTGMGKTEAGLWWIGNNKGYFVLPLRTAINAIYNRIAYDKDKKIVSEKMEERVALLHSSSLSYYLEMRENEKQNELGMDDFDVEAYQKRGQQHSIPLNITTMDQIFDFVFKYQGHELKLVTLSYSKIVVDEIQMYDSHLLAYLLTGIKRICQLGGKVAVLTATLAPFIEDELKKIMPGLKKGEFIDDSIRRHNLLVKETALNVEDVLEQFTRNKKEKSGNKILVICNTVKKSQEVYEALKTSDRSDRLQKDELFLLHAKFTRGDRASKETAIKEFGKTYVDNKVENKQVDIQNGIWVSTSLVEASLDIDFDYLFTELQDLNSLLQRLGRCNRKGAKSVEATNCFVYTVIDEKSLRINNRGFIDYDIFNMSKGALGNWDGSITEKEKLALIAETFTTEKIKVSEYYKEYKNTCKYIEAIDFYEIDQEDIKLREIFTEAIIPSPVYEDNKERIDELVQLINKPNTDNKSKIAHKEKLYAYTVSVESYQVKNYERAGRDNKAIYFKPIQLGKYETIKVIECQYDKELGFRAVDFNEPRGAMFY